MHNIFLGGIFTKRASGPRVISFIQCGHGYCRGSQGMTPWMVNAVNFSEGRINRKTKPHLQTFPNEVKTQSRGLRRRRAADVGAGSQTRTDPHPTVHVYMLPMEQKKMQLLCKKKKFQNGPSRIQSTQGNRRHMLSSSTTGLFVSQRGQWKRRHVCRINASINPPLHVAARRKKKKAVIIRAMSE